MDRPDDLVARILDLALQILGAQRGMVLLRGDDGELSPVAVRDIQEQEIDALRQYSHTAVEEALSGQPVVALNVSSDPRYSRLASVNHYDIRSLICVPLRISDRILGVLYIDSTKRSAPFEGEDLRFLDTFASQAALALDSARLYRRLRRENHRLVGQARVRAHYEGLHGRSHAMQLVYDLLDRAAESPFPTLLLGETGTGKDVAARALHQRSPRRAGPFLALNCAAFREELLESELFGHVRGAFTGADSERRGVFDLAHGGVLFLDEIGHMSERMQAKLLRVLQDGTFRPLGSGTTRAADVRILAATNRDLDALVRAREFREDLFYRLNVIRIVLPPLRQRREDIPQLIEHFIKRALGSGDLPAPSFSPSALRELRIHSWPGNVRELEHTVQRIILHAKDGAVSRKLVRQLLSHQVSPTAPDATGFPSLRELESRHIRQALTVCQWNREEAARRLGIGRATIYRKMKDYRIIPPPHGKAGPQRPPGPRHKQP